jgi:hypothetical protein
MQLMELVVAKTTWIGRRPLVTMVKPDHSQVFLGAFVSATELRLSNGTTWNFREIHWETIAIHHLVA